MKETIYTIPINEAFDKDCNCPICTIENKLEADGIQYALGPAMMEPDFRELCNKKGFCKTHYKSLIESKKALPLALVLQSYLQQQYEDIFADKVNEKTPKKGLFSKGSDELTSALKMSEHINTTSSSCVVCEKVSETMNRYFTNIIYIWKTQPEFRQKFASKKGFCIPHFAKLLDFASKGLSAEDFKEFYHTIVNMQEKHIDKIYEDVSAFTRLFDHASDKKATDEVKNSTKNSIQLASGLNCQND